MKNIAGTALAVVLLPSCSLFWLLGSDPEGLPCALDDPPCLDGYVCVEDQCLKAGAKKAGDLCTLTEECADNLFCASGYEECAGDGADDVNCAIAGPGAQDKKCRVICESHDACENNERCFVVSDVAGITGFCQDGTCASDSDCQAVAGSPGLCAGVVGPGRTGFCMESCDPLTCQNNECPGCDGLDNTPDVGVGCMPMPGETLSVRTVCDAAGQSEFGAACGGVNDDLCAPGYFCFAPTVGNPYCSKWCGYSQIIFEGDNPACATGVECTPVGVEETAELGFCQQ